MWKASASVAVIEVVAYAVFAIVSMVRAGEGSGVWIPFLPIAWLILAVRIWVVMRVAGAFVDEQSMWGFVGVAAAISFLGSLFFFAMVGVSTDKWSNFGALPMIAIAPVAAAFLLARNRAIQGAMVEGSGRD